MVNVRQPEIDHHTLKLVVGIIAISLAPLTSWFAEGSLESVSASYFEAGAASDVFVGFLCAIAAFLAAYNGRGPKEMIASKTAAVAALVIAFFPCDCPDERATCSGEAVVDVPYAHGVATAVMFAILVYFCIGFFRRARAKGHARARVRAAVYASCAVAMTLSIAAVGVVWFSNGRVRFGLEHPTFWGEAVALSAFGVAWLVASRTLPVVTRPEERKKLL